MAQQLLESSALSAFCGSLATMLSAGIQTDEAVHMLGENNGESQFHAVCDQVYGQLIQGNSLAQSMEATGAFPRYATDMVATGERSGRLEEVLRNLDQYYDEEDRMFAKLRSSVGYPAALLVIMAIILGFTVAVILPVFTSVYESMSGSLVAGSFGSVGVSMVIGYVALAVTAVCAVVALVMAFMARTEHGRLRVMSLFERLPFTRGAMRQLALARFTSALATYTASGVTNEEAMTRAIDTVDHADLKPVLEAARDSMMDMDNPRSLAQAFTEHGVFESLYARLLTVGARTGSIDSVLSRLSGTFFDDAFDQLGAAIDRIEPVLAALLTCAVGATLVAVMLPLIGIMGSIG